PVAANGAKEIPGQQRAHRAAPVVADVVRQQVAAVDQVAFGVQVTGARGVVDDAAGLVNGPELDVRFPDGEVHHERAGLAVVVNGDLLDGGFAAHADAAGNVGPLVAELEVVDRGKFAEG